ncbi:MAG: CsbD family protein [Microbacterium sp.]|nr:MAG: CsbD family protein [Microbacterium sp.]
MPGLDDRIENKVQDIAGRGKEAAGSVTGDDSLKAEGEADQKKASIKDKVEDVKDKVQQKVDDIL